MNGMLDLRTIFALGVTTAALEGVTWLLFWIAWRRLDALKYFAAGFSTMSIALVLMTLRGSEVPAWWIVIDNLLIKLGLVLIAIGLSRFLEQPPRTKLMFGMVAALLLAWIASVQLAPSNVSVRFLLSAMFTLGMMSLMSLSLARDRSMPRMLRWVMIAVLVYYMVISVVATILEFRAPPDPGGLALLGDRHAWYLLQGNIVLTGMFASLILMVSWRLSADLRANNAALLDEIEQRRRLERELSASLDTERQLREEQADFTRLVSHEFRTPLATIRNATEMIGLAGRGIDPDARDRLTGISQSLDRLSALIDRFLSGSDEGGFHPEPLPPDDLLADVMLHFDMVGGGDRLRVCPAEVGTELRADADMLLTAIINLIDNALKYAPPDSPVELAILADRDTAIIRVSDRGIGIPDADRTRIGRRFVRASNTTPGTGTGMGLYAARRLVSYHGGEVVLAPRPGGGTIAEIRLPSTNASPEPREQKEPEWH
ncbi:hypothetical protein ATO3_19275 [Marinibacterium profundimaris]|uniref:histidine kinase n=2 Tax=Marinibacterium profundimaris TaxID=1679460 RepID=A0A225NEF2_9RHOB|nr:hypothetical protein ATO3_19275 [Marinibacterium profundimaris]